MSDTPSPAEPSGGTPVATDDFLAIQRLVHRYVDAVVGFRTDNYRPTPLPDDMTAPSQHLFVGVSLNGQAVLDRLLAGGGRPRRAARTVAHGVTEVFNVPFTSYGVGPTRSCAPPTCTLD